MSFRRNLFAAFATILLLGSLAGCSSKGDYSAEFLRYQTLEDGTRVAIVAPTAAGADPEQAAYSKFDDLKRGERVIVGWVGRSWDTPQWMPEREIVSRADSR